MRRLHLGNQSLHLACPTLAAWLLATIPAAAQEVVELPGEDRWLDADFEVVYRVGSFGGEDWEQFGDIVSLGFDGVGNLYVLDRQAARVTVVAPDGSYLRDFGREGEGPGEFRSPTRLAVMAHGDVVVFESNRNAFHIFDANGSIKRTARIPGNPLLTILPELDPHLDRDVIVLIPNGVVATVSRAMMATGGQIGVNGTTRPVERLVLSGDEVLLEEITTAWAPPPGVPHGQVAGRITVTVGSGLAFAPDLFVAALPGGGVAFSDSSAYAIKVSDSDGTIQRILSRPLQPEPVTDRIREEERARRLEELDREAESSDPLPERFAAMAAQALETRRNDIETLQFFAEVPIVRGLRTGWEGTIWIQRAGGYAVGDGPVDVLAADGGYLGSFRPGTTTIPAAFGPDGLVAFIAVDELEVESVVVRRLPSAVR